MARILYSAVGAGLGHVTRAHSVGGGLLQRGHDVRFVTSLAATGYLQQHFPGRVDDIFGLSFSFNRGRTALLPTVIDNAGRAWAQLRPSVRVLRRLFREFRADLVITDLEPFVANWARRMGVPFISLDNHHIVTHCVLDQPPGFLVSRMGNYLVTRLAYAGAKRYLITTFFPARIRYQPTTLLVPILRPAVYGKQATTGDFLVAYAGAGGGHDSMRPALEAYDGLPIRAYGFSRTGRHRHITYQAASTEGFLDDLAACAGVVATAGHSLICECFHLGKPMLVAPLAGQYEQCINAYHVERLGGGKSIRRLDTQAIDSFVSRLDTYRTALTRIPKASLDPVLDAIEREIP